MDRIWIAEAGTVREEDVPALLEKYAGGGRKYCCAFYTDHFQSAVITGAGDPLAGRLLADIGQLLELRLFDEDRELLLYRSMIGRPFSFRAADDPLLISRLSGQSDPFLQKMEAHRVEQVQLIDADMAHYRPWLEKTTDAFGARLLRTTSGGTYNLPIRDGENALLTVGYIEYGPNGAASIADVRWAGFVDEGEWRTNHESC